MLARVSYSTAESSGITRCQPDLKPGTWQTNKINAGTEAELRNVRDEQGTPRSPATFAARRGAPTDSGVVLLIVLWWLALLMFLAAQVVTVTHTSVLIAANIRSSAVAEAQADGAVNEAIFHVLAHDWKADETSHVVRGTQSVAEVRIANEGGKIDPNVAPAVLMQALLRGCGVPSKAAAELANAISEWRSVDLLQSTGARTAPQYGIAGRHYLPPHSRFVSVDELGLVLGMTPELLACLEPHVSVYSLSVPSLQTTADPVVRQALTEAYPYETPQTVAETVPEVAVIRVTAIAMHAGGSRFRRVAVVRVVPAEPDELFIYKILFWEGSAD
jgi:general secretion pathway protein K